MGVIFCIAMRKITGETEIENAWIKILHCIPLDLARHRITNELVGAARLDQGCLMLRAGFMNVVNETTHEGSKALALITLGSTACSTLYWPPLALLTILVCAAHVTAIRKRISTSARIAERSPELFPPHSTFLAVVYTQPLYHFGHHDRLEFGDMLRRNTDEVAVVLFVHLLALGKVFDMSSSIEWNGWHKEK